MNNLSEQDFPFVITKNSISITYNGTTTVYNSENKIYNNLIFAIKNKKWNDIPHIMNPELKIEKFSHSLMSIKNNKVFLLDEENSKEFSLPDKLNERVIFFLDEGLDAKPLINFALKLKNNPSYRSIDQLFEFLDHNGFTICSDGDFIAYKGITFDYKDCWTKTIDNSLGATVKMSRNEVNDNPAETCSNGLHVANYTYAHTNYGGGAAGLTIEVKVNPANVVCVPLEHDAAKMRVCEYTVLRLSDGPQKDGIYNHLWDDPEEENIDDYLDDDDSCDSCRDNEDDPDSERYDDSGCPIDLDYPEEDPLGQE